MPCPIWGPETEIVGTLGYFPFNSNGYLSLYMDCKGSIQDTYLGASLVAQWLRIRLPNFPGGAAVKNLPANAGDTGSSPGPGRFHMPWNS